jgi:hypothetical protein
MGYRRESRRITLVFDDPDLNGLEVVTRSVPLGTFLAMLDSSSDVAKTMQLFQDFAENALIEWNLEDDNGSVPATLAGMKTQDADFMLSIVKAWLDAIGTASAPLVGASSNGVISDFQH